MNSTTDRLTPQAPPQQTIRELKENTFIFVKDKALRLLVPWLVCVFTHASLQAYLERVTHGQFSGSYFQEGLRVCLSRDGGLTWCGPGDHYGYEIDSTSNPVRSSSGSS